MGIFHVRIGVANPAGGDTEQVLALVDTGATHSIMPASLLERLHLQPIDQKPVFLADNRREMWPVGEARISYQDKARTCMVIFGAEEQYLLGATTLENFGLMVDPVAKELVPSTIRARPF